MNAEVRARRFLVLGWGYWWESAYNNLYVLNAAGERVAVADVRLHIRSAAERGEFALAQLLQCYADSAMPVPLSARIADQFAGVGLVDILERVEHEPGGSARVTICPYLHGLDQLLCEQTCITPGASWRFVADGRVSFPILVPQWWLESDKVTT